MLDAFPDVPIAADGSKRYWAKAFGNRTIPFDISFKQPAKTLVPRTATKGTLLPQQTTWLSKSAGIAEAASKIAASARAEAPQKQTLPPAKHQPPAATTRTKAPPKSPPATKSPLTTSQPGATAPGVNATQVNHGAQHNIAPDKPGVAPVKPMAPPKKPKRKKNKNKGDQNLALEEVSDPPLEPETQKVSALLAQSSVRLHVAGLAPNTIPTRYYSMLGLTGWSLLLSQVRKRFCSFMLR